MKTNKNAEKQTPTLPFKIDDRVWVAAINGEFSHRLQLIIAPNKKRGINFYIFLYKGRNADEDNLLIIKPEYLKNFFFRRTRKEMEDLLLTVGRAKYAEVFPAGTNLEEKVTISNTDASFMQLIIDLPQKEKDAGFKVLNPDNLSQPAQPAPESEEV